MSHRDFTKYVFLAFFVISLGNYGQSKETRTNFRATENFVFQFTLRPDILYNPEYVTIVKHRDLNPWHGQSSQSGN